MKSGFLLDDSKCAKFPGEATGVSVAAWLLCFIADWALLLADEGFLGAFELL